MRTETKASGSREHSDLIQLIPLKAKFFPRPRCDPIVVRLMMTSFLLDTVVPGLGATISLAMYGTPLSAVLKAAQNKTLGDLNALPFSITVANTIIWLIYGVRGPYTMSHASC